MRNASCRAHWKYRGGDIELLQAAFIFRAGFILFFYLCQHI
jgi:hypothetical protein